MGDMLLVIDICPLSEYFAMEKERQKITKVNLDRSLKLLHTATGSTPRLYNSPLHSTAATPTLFRGDELSFLPTPTRKRNSSLMPSEMDHTLSLLGGRQIDLSTSYVSSPNLDVDTTNVTLLMEEQNAVLESTGICEEFGRVFLDCSTPNQVFDMLASYREVLAQKTQLSKSLLQSTSRRNTRLTDLQSHHNILRDEMWTWQLAESLLRDTTNAELRAGEDELMNEDNPHTVTTDQQLMEQFFESNDKVRKCQIVVDWLETINSEDVLENFYNKVDFYTGKIGTMWENTLHLKKNSAQKAKNLVSEMDPDAPLRTGKKIDSLDQEDDERLLKYIFTLLRAGKLEEAQKLCIRCGQAWRAASLEGWRLAHDPNYTSDSQDHLPISGNNFRDVWKAACWSLTQEALSTHEKAIYACLSGNLEHLLPVCDTWSDGLWAHLKVLLDVELEQHLRLHTSSNDHQIVELPSSYWTATTNLAQVFKDLEASCNDKIREQSQLFFHKIQKFLVLGDFEC
ncbi:NUP107 [Bugula neritina]|uniref:Nuclear pore complex protein n=1 Tax=Bugula neritina TaxID=10212 RepID=A0A7J7JIC1_BUGNE|nr:NUP107 [Bugula neritina]